MSTYLLIHGAWHGGWCWSKGGAAARGQRSPSPRAGFTGARGRQNSCCCGHAAHYTDRICEIVSAETEPVILAGHSMGGIAITQAAENCPKHIGALVVNPTTTIPRDDGTIAFKPEHSREAYYGDCTDEDAAFAESRLVAQSAAPFGTPVETTPERWGRIPRYYIECERDRAITFRLQREMQKLSPCRQTFSIDTDHSPFLSVPKQLADILLRIGSA